MKLLLSLTPQRFIQTFLARFYILELLKNQEVHGYDCFWDRFPLTIGSDSGITKITHLGYETNDVLYMAGIS